MLDQECARDHIMPLQGLWNLAVINYQCRCIRGINGRISFSYNLFIGNPESSNTNTCIDWMRRYRNTSATTLVYVRNTRVSRTALMALTEPRTLWRGITRCPSPMRRVQVYWTDVVPGAPGSTSNHSRAVWENNFFFGNAAGAPGNHSYY